jgi:fumarate reductase (CoM/CoB) subunit B
MIVVRSLSLAKARDCIQAFVDGCIDCGICRVNCSLQAAGNLTVREMLQDVLDGTPSAETVAFLSRCALCGLCTGDCLVNLDVPRAVMAARQLLLESGAINLEDYKVMLVDQGVHLFTIYRDTYGINYGDLKRQHCDTVFFPGCTFSSYAPELTRAAHAWLEEREGQVGLVEECCGSPLAQIGLARRAEHFTARLSAQFANLGARRVVTACPHCYYYLKETVRGVEINSLYDLMDGRHFRVHSEKVLTVHDSCRDRSGQIGAVLRHLMDGARLAEMPHHGASTLCCGSGGLVSMVDPDLCIERAKTRLVEFEQTGADECVTACMACAYRLARGSSAARVVHLLELAFGITIDYEQVQARAQALWEGEWGANNLARLAGARVT